MSNFIVIFIFSIIFITTTYAHEITRPASAPNPSPNSKSISLHPNPNLKPELSPTSPHNFNRHGNAYGNANLKFGRFGLPQHAKPPSPKPERIAMSPEKTKSKPKRVATSPEKPKPKPKTIATSPVKSKPKSKTNATSPVKSKPKSKTNATSPYQSANRFCLSRRLDVKTTFCLQVLRSGPTGANDDRALLGAGAGAGVRVCNKTISLLKKLSPEKKKKKKKKLESKAALTECVSAYEGYVKQFENLLEEAQIQAQLAGYDSELAKLEIQRCARALKKAKNDEIESENKVALDHASLAQNIADAIR